MMQTLVSSLERSRAAMANDLAAVSTQNVELSEKVDTIPQLQTKLQVFTLTHPPSLGPRLYLLHTMILHVTFELCPKGAVSDRIQRSHVKSLCAEEEEPGTKATPILSFIAPSHAHTHLHHRSYRKGTRLCFRCMGRKQRRQKS